MLSTRTPSLGYGSCRPVMETFPQETHQSCHHRLFFYCLQKLQAFYLPKEKKVQGVEFTIYGQTYCHEAKQFFPGRVQKLLCFS